MARTSPQVAPFSNPIAPPTELPDKLIEATAPVEFSDGGPHKGTIQYKLADHKKPEFSSSLPSVRDYTP